MATHPDFPGASSFNDASGKERWRYRSKGKNQKTRTLPGMPGDEAFAVAYERAMLELEGKDAAILQFRPAAKDDRTFAALERLMELECPEWAKRDQKTKAYNRVKLATFLDWPIEPGYEMKWREAKVSDLKPGHVRDFIDFWRNPRHSIGDRVCSAGVAKHLKTALNRLIQFGIEKRWIEYNPTVGVKTPKPKTAGHKPWPDAICEQFERHHKPGTAARTCYALARWLGNRRGDVAALRWDQLVTVSIPNGDGTFKVVTGFQFKQKKNANRRADGGKDMFLAVTSELKTSVIQAPGKRGETVLTNSWGKPYAEESLTQRMADWCRAANIPAGYTMHGLRKTFAIDLANRGVTSIQLMHALGHDRVEEANPYIQEAARISTATDALELFDLGPARHRQPRLRAV